MQLKILLLIPLLLILTSQKLLADVQWRNPSPESALDPDCIDDRYRKRGNNRSEGFKPVEAGGGIELIGLGTNGALAHTSTSKLDEGSNLKLQIPRLTKYSQPTVIINYKKYWVDNIRLDITNDFYYFEWPSCLLDKREIPIEQLRLIAALPNKLYLPIIFEGGSDIYNFVFKSKKNVKFTSFRVLDDQGEIYFDYSSDKFHSGEINFNWNGHHYLSNTEAPLGRYRIFYCFQFNSSKSKNCNEIFFEHSPAWLKPSS